jgi:hypothetical protein
VRETAEDVARLQALLDASHLRAGPHLKSIFQPERRFTARELVNFFAGKRQVAVATVTAAGEPRVAPLDALLLEGRFHFGTHRTAVRVRHLRARSAVSLAYFERDELAVVVHGNAELLEFGDDGFASVDQAFVDVYGGTPSTAEEGSVYARIDAAKMFTYARDRSSLRAVDIGDWPGRARAETFRQWHVIAQAADTVTGIPELDGLLLLGSFAAGAPDELSDVDLVAVAGTGRFREAWRRRAELETRGTATAWDVIDGRAADVASHKWITRELVKVECTIVDPAAGGMRLADPVAVVVGEAGLVERFPRMPPPSRGALDAYARELREAGDVPAAERLYEELKRALRAASRDADT